MPMHGWEAEELMKMDGLRLGKKKRRPAEEKGAEVPGVRVPCRSRDRLKEITGAHTGKEVKNANT